MRHGFHELGLQRKKRRSGVHGRPKRKDMRGLVSQWQREVLGRLDEYLASRAHKLYSHPRYDDCRVCCWSKGLRLSTGGGLGVRG